MHIIPAFKNKIFQSLPRSHPKLKKKRKYNHIYMYIDVQYAISHLHAPVSRGVLPTRIYSWFKHIYT